MLSFERQMTHGLSQPWSLTGPLIMDLTVKSTRDERNNGLKKEPGGGQNWDSHIFFF